MLHDVALDLAPALAGFVSASPAAFGTVLADQPYVVQLAFSVPPYAPAGTYSGTLRARVGSRTIARPLELVINLSFGGNVIGSDVRVLSPTAAQLISGVSADGRTLTFSSSSPELRSLREGNVLVVGVSLSTPYGFLGQVANIEGVGPVVVRTVPASLSDVFLSADVSTSFSVPSADAPAASRLPVAGMHEVVPPWSLELKDVILYDDDGDPGTKSDQVRATVQLSGSAGVDFRLSIRDSRISSLYFAGRTTLSTQLTAEATVTAEVTKSKIFDSPSFSTTFVIWIGYIPVVLVAKIQPTLGAHGEVSAGLETTVTDTSSVVGGVSYTDGVVTPIADFSNQFGFEPPTFAAGGDLKVWAGPVLRLFILNVVGPELDTKPFLEGKVDVLPAFHWQLFAGLDVSLRIVGQILAFDFLDIEVPALISFKRLLAEGPAPAAVTIDFEQFTGLPYFTGMQPPLTVGNATFHGGQLLTHTTNLPADQSTVYGTASPYCPDCLPSISISFAQAVSNLSVFVINGNTVTVTYTVRDDQGGMVTTTLTPNFASGAGTVLLPDSNIQLVTITSGPAPGGCCGWDFFIDDVSFTPVPLP